MPWYRAEDVRYEISFDKEQVYKREQFPIVVEAVGEVNKSPISWRRELGGKQRKTTFGGATELRDIASRLNAQFRVGNKSVVFPLIAYYGAGRLFRQKQERMLRPLTPNEVTYAYHTALASEADFNYQLWWWQTNILANHGSIRGNQLLGALYDAVLTTMGNDWSELTYGWDLGTIIIKDQQGVWQQIESLSDGQRSTLAMALDIAYRCIVLNPGLGENAPKQTPGVALVDELDLHLHPKWQRSIVDNLREAFPQVQFIATTHSPLIIQSLRPGEVIDLSGGEPRDYFKQSVEEILTDEMGLTDVRRNREYQEMMQTAEEFYQLLEKGHSADDVVVQDLQQKLDDLTLPYHDNPAYRAYREFLQQRVLVAAGDCE